MSIAEQTLANIVTRDHRAATVFEKYELDFCCKGKRTLAAACEEKGFPAGQVVEELSVVCDTSSPTFMPFTEMTAEQLIAHILTHHHFYVKQIMPQLYYHLEKVAMKHGERFPEMVEVFHLFNQVKNEMTHHLHKEEVVLFPAIKAKEAARNQEQQGGMEGNIIPAAINVMEAEHDLAGDLMQKIRTLTRNYQEPPGACTTFKVSLAELRSFEEDLHRHVHLENHLLFPLALSWS